MKKQTFFSSIHSFTGMVLAFLFLSFVSCQKDSVAKEQGIEPKDQTTHNDNLSGAVTSRMPTTCECEYQIVSVSSASFYYYLTGSELCADQCLNMSAYSNDCLSHTSCDDLMPSSYPTSYYLFNCAVAGSSSFNAVLYPHLTSDCATPTSGSLQFRVKCVQKPSGSCGLGTYYTSNTKTISYSPGGANPPAVVTMGGCGCEPTIY